MTRTKGRALWMPDVLRDAGIPFVVDAGWEHRGKEPTEWLAICNHHTASNERSGPEPSRGIVRSGRPDVPGPLANTLPRRDGVIVIMASGAANHPGVSYLPLRGGIASGVKYYCLGHEIELSGVGEPFPVEGRQYESVARMNAAFCIYLGLDPATAVWDHKSICRPAGRKIDVRPYDLADGRVRIARRMVGRPTSNRPTPAPTPAQLEEIELMAAKDDILKALRPIAYRLTKDGPAGSGLHKDDVWIVGPYGRTKLTGTGGPTGQKQKALDALAIASQISSKVPVPIAPEQIVALADLGA